MIKRKPHWLKVRPPSDEAIRLKRFLKKLKLHTVCEEAHCPNIHTCWGGGTATLMLMGDICTRGCRFCNVNHGKPSPLDPLEPQRVADAVAKLKLDYVVLTSVDRDDLPDFGASHLAEAIITIKKKYPEVIVEALIPDFQGKIELLSKVVSASPEVIGHNIETVERLTPKVRDVRAGYRQSLEVLRNVKILDHKIYTKSSIMLGLGETEEEVITTMYDLKKARVDILTLGQYLQPSPKHLEVVEYIHPDKFSYYKKLGEEMGFLYVASGPLVRSSYKAGELFDKSLA
jgi:lipoic acid synthetase